MTEKRYYAHKYLLENKVHDRICHNLMNIDETVEHMNNQYWKYKQLKKENEQLKQLLNNKETEWLRNNSVWEQMPSSHVPKTSLRPKPTKKCSMGEDKDCGTCKYFQLDGMFGMWCDLGKDWKNVKYCSDWER